MTQPRNQLALTFDSDPGVPRRPLVDDLEMGAVAAPTTGGGRRAGPQIERPWIRRSPPASRKPADGPAWLEAPADPRPADAEPAWVVEEALAAAPSEERTTEPPDAPSPREAITQPLPEAPWDDLPQLAGAGVPAGQHDTDPDPRPLGISARQPEAVRQREVVAALWRRAVAGLVDGAIVLVTVGGAAALGAWAFGTDRLAPAAARGLDFFADALLPHRGLVVSLVLLAAAQLFAYEWLSLAFGGRTAGQALTGVRVVSEDGGALDLAASARRALALLASLATFGFGLALALFDGRRQTLHDKVAGSLVVPAVPDEA